jgi:hypothetical protein
MINIYITVGLVLASFMAGWYTNGNRLELDYKKRENIAILKAVQEERIDAKAVNDLMVGYEIQKVKDEQTRKERNNHIASRAITLSVPVSASSCIVSPAANDTAGTTTEARVELKPAHAQRIIDITDDGDKAIEQCNKLIDVVEALK